MRYCRNNYKEKYDNSIIEIVKQKESAGRKILSLKIFIGVFSLIILLGFTFSAAFFEMQGWLRGCLIVAGFVISLAGFGFARR